MEHTTGTNQNALFQLGIATLKALCAMSDEMSQKTIQEFIDDEHKLKNTLRQAFLEAEPNQNEEDTGDEVEETISHTITTFQLMVDHELTIEQLIAVAVEKKKYSSVDKDINSINFPKSCDKAGKEEIEVQVVNFDFSGYVSSNRVLALLDGIGMKPLNPFYLLCLGNQYPNLRLAYDDESHRCKPAIVALDQALNRRGNSKDNPWVVSLGDPGFPNISCVDLPRMRNIGDRRYSFLAIYK